LKNLNSLPQNIQIILFDGVCNLCNEAIQVIIKKDKKKIFRYASLQSEIGKQLLKERNINSGKIDSIILIDPNVAFYIKSTAALEISKKMSGLYPVFSIFLILPTKLRDWVYDFIARNRYRWFGKKDACIIPTPELKALFLDT